MKNQEFQQQSIEDQITLFILGDNQVGKTSLIIRYTQDIFDEVYNHKKTLNCNSLLKNDVSKSIFIENQCVHLQIHDISGPEKYIFIDRVYRKAQGIFIVYDVTNRYSFNSIQQWISQIDNIANEGVIRILIGNKCDQKDNRAVTFEEGNLLAQQYGIPFFETSVKLSINIENSLIFLIKLIMQKQEQQQQQQLIIKNEKKNQKLKLKQNNQSKNIQSCI
ncbi:unnamed protein product [Paramecium pentaurelia]|uniref:Uncharacterized protein n=1 Tax=Paramecium pentaurelia TaxID=43138 RepID=A0A8S1RYD0_9CILI|nr:unnamed protein product [Paramecium pentaurelia]